MIEKRTVVDQIEITRRGHIQIRFGLLLVENGVEISCRWHRTVIEPGGSVEAMVAAVDAGLAAMNAARIDRADPPTIKSVCQLVHTPDMVEKHRAAVREAQSQLVPSVERAP